MHTWFDEPVQLRDYNLKYLSFCPVCLDWFIAHQSSVSRFKNGLSKQPTCSQSCSKKLDHKNINGIYKKYKITKELVDSFIIEYNSGISCPKIAQKYNVSALTVNNYLNVNKVIIRDISSCRRKYTFDENYFESLDSQEKAYWYGFILADGCVVKINEIQKDLKIEIAIIDIGHLEKFKKQLKSTNPIRTRFSTNGYGTGKSAIFSIRSQKIVDDLFTHGLITNKTSKEIYPQQLSIELQRHFWRGCIDGDGWVCLLKRRNKKGAGTGLCGSKDIIEKFRDFVKGLVNFEYRIGFQRNCYNLHISGSNAITLLDYIYADSTIFLDRKYKTYKQIKEYELTNQ